MIPANISAYVSSQLNGARVQLSQPLDYRDRASAFSLVTALVFTWTLWHLPPPTFASAILTQGRFGPPLHTPVNTVLKYVYWMFILTLIRLFFSLVLLEQSRNAFETLLEPLRCVGRVATFMVYGIEFVLRVGAVFWLTYFLGRLTSASGNDPRSVFYAFALCFVPLLAWDVLLIVRALASPLRFPELPPEKIKERKKRFQRYLTLSAVGDGLMLIPAWLFYVSLKWWPDGAIIMLFQFGWLFLVLVVVALIADLVLNLRDYVVLISDFSRTFADNNLAGSPMREVTSERRAEAAHSREPSPE